MESLVAHIAHRARARLRVLHVDIDRRTDLLARFDLRDVRTALLVVDKKVVARIDGRASAPKMDAMLAEHLAPVAV